MSEVHKADRILGSRWWSPAELADEHADPLWPPQLPALLAAVREPWLNGRTPNGDAQITPVELGYVPNSNGD